jgi:Asp-tRNA(Asn)/Glu-tRNA(Gln) amidotransferase A subunit family amidase
MTQRSATDRLERALADIAAGSAEGAWWHLDAAGARAAAGESDRRIAAGDAPRALEGALVGVKANIAVRGWPLTAGRAPTRRTCSPHHRCASTAG